MRQNCRAGLLLTLGWLALSGAAFAQPSTHPISAPAAAAATPSAPVPATNDPATLSGEVVQVYHTKNHVEIPERFARVIQTRRRISRVDGFDPGVIGVSALSHDQLRVQGIAEGVTTMVLTDESGENLTVEVLVTGDARLLQAVLRREFPHTAVTAVKLRDNILLRGWVTEPSQIPQIVEIAQLYYPQVLNQMKVGGPQQVQLRCKVMEVQRSKIRQLGFNFSYANQNFAIGSAPGPITPISSLAVPFGGPPGVGLASSSLSNATLALGIVSDNQAFAGVVQALHNEGLLKIQAEPTITTRSGEPAKIVSGGEFPIPVPQGLGTVAIEWREFGVRLESVPLILSPSRLKQTIIAEVSEKDLTNAVVIASTTVPGLNKRTVETQVEMNFGQTLAIGGLISTRKTSETQKVPFLGELPWIGAAFRRVRYDETETELLVLITPEFISAIDPQDLPPGGVGHNSATPTDRELFGDGAIEVPNYGEPCADCGPHGRPGPAGLPAGTIVPSNQTPVFGPTPGLITPTPLPDTLPQPVPTTPPGFSEPTGPDGPASEPIPPAPGVSQRRTGGGTKAAAGTKSWPAAPEQKTAAPRKASNSTPGMILPASASFQDR